MPVFRKNRNRLDGLPGRVWSGDDDRATAFRLDLPDSNGVRPPSSRGKLFHYIAAGGLRQTRAQRHEHPELEARARVVRMFCLLVAFWLIFRFA